MFCIPRSTFRPALALLALATVALALVTGPARAAGTPPAAKHRADQRLVVRGDRPAARRPRRRHRRRRAL
jgi:hypothetical protein